jgi:hypothetical protein
MDEQELKLNGISRYSKRSPRLVLEEYGHCEVPAGCGGVVLRWRKPNQPVPALLSESACNGPLAYLGLNGEDTDFDSKISVPFGQNLLTLICKPRSLQHAIIHMSVICDEQYVSALNLQGDTKLTSQADGTWKYSLEPQTNDRWQQADFDDSTWLPLIAQALTSTGNHPWQQGEILEDIRTKQVQSGSLGLGIDLSLPQVQQAQANYGQDLQIYVRKQFSIWPQEQDNA